MRKHHKRRLRPPRSHIGSKAAEIRRPVLLQPIRIDCGSVLHSSIPPPPLSGTSRHKVGPGSLHHNRRRSNLPRPAPPPVVDEEAGQNLRLSSFAETRTSFGIKEKEKEQEEEQEKDQDRYYWSHDVLPLAPSRPGPRHGRRSLERWAGPSRLNWPTLKIYTAI